MLACALFIATSCSSSSTADGPRTPPPTAGPSGSADIVGIWRNVHQGVFELRDDKTFVLISPIAEPEAGRYTLDGDRLQIQAEKGCGVTPGRYQVRVATANRMDLSDPHDACASRRRVLTGDPFIYTPR